MLSCLTLVYICKIAIQELSLNENEINSSHMQKKSYSTSGLSHFIVLELF